MTRLTILRPPPRWLALIATAGVVVIVATAVVVALSSNRDAGGERIDRADSDGAARAAAGDAEPGDGQVDAAAYLRGGNERPQRERLAWVLRLPFGGRVRADGEPVPAVARSAWWPREGASQPDGPVPQRAHRPVPAEGRRPGAALHSG